MLHGRAAVVPRLRVVADINIASVRHAWGCHAVTGGTSGLGLLTARWLAQRGAHSLALASRSGLLPRSATAEWLQTMNAKALLQQCDTAEATHVHRLVALAQDPLLASAVWHAAGVLADAVLPKVSGLDTARLGVCRRHNSGLQSFGCHTWLPSAGQGRMPPCVCQGTLRRCSRCSDISVLQSTSSSKWDPV